MCWWAVKLLTNTQTWNLIQCVKSSHLYHKVFKDSISCVLCDYKILKVKVYTTNTTPSWLHIISTLYIINWKYKHCTVVMYMRIPLIIHNNQRHPRGSSQWSENKLSLTNNMAVVSLDYRAPSMSSSLDDSPGTDSVRFPVYGPQCPQVTIVTVLSCITQLAINIQVSTQHSGTWSVFKMFTFCWEIYS